MDSLIVDAWCLASRQGDIAGAMPPGTCLCGQIPVAACDPRYSAKPPNLHNYSVRAPLIPPEGGDDAWSLPMIRLTNNLGEQVRLDQVFEAHHGGTGNGLQSHAGLRTSSMPS